MKKVSHQAVVLLLAGGGRWLVMSSLEEARSK
jgi:hypothetical protein